MAKNLKKVLYFAGMTTLTYGLILTFDCSIVGACSCAVPNLPSAQAEGVVQFDTTVSQIHNDAQVTCALEAQEEFNDVDRIRKVRLTCFDKTNQQRQVVEMELE